MTDHTFIIDTLRNEIRRTPKSVCPFAALAADSTDIVVLSDTKYCHKVVAEYPWKQDSILIIAFDGNVTVADVDSIAAFLGAGFPQLEAFAAHPEHYLPTRKAAFPNVQLNTRVALNKARQRWKR